MTLTTDPRSTDGPAGRSTDGSAAGPGGKADRPSTRPTLDAGERSRLERAFRIPRARFLIGLPIAALLLIWSFNGAEFNFIKLGDGAVNMGEFLSRLFPPDFSKIGTILAVSYTHLTLPTKRIV